MAPAKCVDLGSMLKIITVLGEAADRVQGTLDSMPKNVNAGPFAEELARLTGAVTAHQLELIIRLRLAALTVLIAMGGYAASQCRQVSIVDDIVELLGGLD